MSEIYKQDPPFAVQVELTEGCNLRCSFCGLNGIRGKENNFKFMSRETLVSLMTQISELSWNPRVEFAMHGEPTMHPDFIGMVGAAYAIHPTLQLMLTTNGGGLLRQPGPVENIKALFHNGLNILALDDYDGVRIIAKIRPYLDEICRDLQILWYNYPRDPEGNPHRRAKYPFITCIEDISKAGTGTHSLLNNHSGSGAPLNEVAAGKRCAKPFRELSVRWDGNVAICCNDWRGVYKCGNIVRDGLFNVWHSARMNAARRKLIRGERDFAPCKGCDAISYRVGLLPDKLGRETLPEPDEETENIIHYSNSGTPYTTPVPRSWETQHET